MLLVATDPEKKEPTAPSSICGGEGRAGSSRLTHVRGLQRLRRRTHRLLHSAMPHSR